MDSDFSNNIFWVSLVAQTVKNLPAMWETQVRSLGQEDPLEKGMATHSSILASRIPRTEEPGRPQSVGSQRVNWMTNIPFLIMKLSAITDLSFYPSSLLPFLLSFLPLSLSLYSSFHLLFPWQATTCTEFDSLPLWLSGPSIALVKSLLPEAIWVKVSTNLQQFYKSLTS